MRYKQSTINAKLSASYREKHAGNPHPICECCGKAKAVDNAHIISQKRCKELGLYELIWNILNFVSACRECHRKWDNWKSGDWVYFINIESMLNFLKLHDPKGFNRRIQLTKMYLENE